MSSLLVVNFPKRLKFISQPKENANSLLWELEELCFFTIRSSLSPPDPAASPPPTIHHGCQLHNISISLTKSASRTSYLTRQKKISQSVSCPQGASLFMTCTSLLTLLLLLWRFIAVWPKRVKQKCSAFPVLDKLTWHNLCSRTGISQKKLHLFNLPATKALPVRFWLVLWRLCLWYNDCARLAGLVRGAPASQSVLPKLMKIHADLFDSAISRIFASWLHLYQATGRTRIQT